MKFAYTKRSILDSKTKNTIFKLFSLFGSSYSENKFMS
jgi:hypothetical protein